MPVTITVRNVPDEVRNELASRAAREGRSMQEYLSEQLRRLATAPSAAEALARARMAARSLPDLSMEEVVQAVHGGRP